MDAAALRPLGIGEVLDTSIKVYRARFGTLVKATTAVVAPVYALYALVELSLAESPESFEADGAAADAGGFVVTLLLLFATQFATAIAVEIVRGAYVGEHIPWIDAVRKAWSKAGSLVWLTALFLLATAGFIIGIVIGAVAGLPVFTPLVIAAVVVGALYCYVTWMVSIPALVAEDVRGTKAMRRSAHLVRKRWWPTFTAVFLAALLAQILMAAVAGLTLGFLNTSSWTALILVSTLVNVVTAVLATPFIAAVVVVVYFDLRVRKEGFDLELLARRMAAPAAPQVPDMAQAFQPPDMPQAPEARPRRRRPAPETQPPAWPSRPPDA